MFLSSNQGFPRASVPVRMRVRKVLFRLLAAALLIGAVESKAQYVAGDYGSWVTGAWNTAATWRVYDGASWATSPAAGVAPNGGNRVWIRAGTTVTAAFGSVYHCQDLFIEATARLYNNNTGGTNLSYVHVYGTTIQCNGNLGNGATLDGISLGINGANVTLSGTGVANAARIRKEFVTHPISGASLATTNFTIGMNVTLRFSSGTNTMMYNGCSATSTFNVNIAAGYTLTLAGAAGTGNIAIDGLDGNGGFPAGGSITVNGTLLIPGILHANTNNAAGAPTCVITINNGGYVRTSQINAAASGVAGHAFNVLAGGHLEITGTPVAWTNYIVTNNSYNIAAGSQTTYSGAGGQDVRNVTGGYGNLRFTGTGLKTLYGTTLAKGNWVIDNVAGTPVVDVTASNFQVTVQGNWTNYNQSGFIENGGLVLFNGTSGTQTITTTGGENFYNWNIQKSLAQPLVMLGSNVQVANQLQLNGTGAIIDLNARLLTILNQNANAIFTTNIAGFGTARHIRSERTDNLSRVRWDIAASPGAHLVPFGTTANYMPFTFNLLSGNAGSVTMATYGTPPDNLPWPATPTPVTNLGSYLGLLSPDNRDATVDRFWQIDPTGTPTAQLTFTYAASELPVAPYNDPLSLRAQRWNSSGQLWETQLAGSAAAYYGIANSVSAFGPFTLSNILSPLPIELLRFTAGADGDRVRLEWATASERENDYFTVLRSRDGLRFEEVFQVDGAGNSSVSIGYEAFDTRPYSGISFYKLRQTDTNGTMKESGAVQVRFMGSRIAPFVYPNPATNVLYLDGLDESAAEVTILDAAGRVVGYFPKGDDSERMELPLAGLPEGSYTLSIFSALGRQALRFVRQ